jgi:hypothetical protein
VPIHPVCCRAPHNSTLAGMHGFHIAMTVAMALCGIGALVGMYGPVPGLLVTSFYFGLWTLMIAIVVAATLGLILIVRAMNKQARLFLARTWLGLANGTVALLFLAWYSVYLSNHAS